MDPLENMPNAEAVLVDESPGGDTEKTPTFSEQFPELAEYLLGAEFTYLYRHLEKPDGVESAWNQLSLNIKAELLHARTMWGRMRGEGEVFTSALEAWMRESIADPKSQGNSYQRYSMLLMYRTLRAPGEKELYVDLLASPAIWNSLDRSTYTSIVRTMEDLHDPSLANSLLALIENLLSDSYLHQEHKEEYARDVARSLVRMMGAPAIDMLEAYAEESETFSDYWQRMRVALSAQKIAENLNDGEMGEPEALPPFDKEEEEKYISALRQKFTEDNEKAQNNKPTGIIHDDWEYQHAYKPHDLLDYGQDSTREEESSDPFTGRDEDRRRYSKKTINFYGRFLPKVEHPVPLTGNNTIEAVYGMLTNPNYKGVEGYLNILSGVTEEGEFVDELPREMSEEEFGKLLSVCIARAESLAFFDKRLDDATDLVRALKCFVEQTTVFADELHSHDNEPTLQVRRVRKSVPPGELPGEFDYGKVSLGALIRKKLAERDSGLSDTARGVNTSVNRSWGLRLSTLQADIEQRDKLNDARRRAGDMNISELPPSAEPFFVYHEQFKKMRRIPAFGELLAEKLRYINALRLATQGGRYFRPPDEWDKQTALYRNVEELDIPVYVEAKENLDEAGANRLAVFGRDGKYLFTALKADNFGTDKRTLKYVIVTRNIESRESRETIARYLQEQGVDLNFHFVDTGYRGSIPELAIESLASAGGVEIPEREVDERIKLISSSTAGRQSLGARHARRTKRDAVSIIEDRPLAIDSPSLYELTDDGKLAPEESPMDISTQLSAWVVEHAVMRNFAPRFEEGPRRKNHEHAMKDYKFLQRFHGGSVVSTHPMELWEGPEGQKVILKGGPEHTLRADYVGARIFEEAGLRVPNTELISHEGELRMRMEYLEGWEDGPATLPSRMHESKNIQKGFFVDLLLQQYDRVSWNMMFRPISRFEEDEVAFIDNGASLHSRARGGYKGFRAHMTVSDIAEVLEHPERPGRPVNEAYAKLAEVINGELVIKDRARVYDLLNRFQQKFADHDDPTLFAKIIDEAGFSDGRRSVERLTEKRAELERALTFYGDADSRDATKTREAIETLSAMISAGGEAIYLKKALLSRARDIVILFEQALESDHRTER